MIPKSILQSSPVALAEMLDAREHRQQVQRQLLEEYGTPLISFTMNIVGGNKVFPLQTRTYEWGVSSIESHCEALGLKIHHRQQLRVNTGYEAFFVVDGEALEIKKIICQLEEKYAIGRLFDMDVIRLDGTKVSRQEIGREGRRCLLCSAPAFQCARSRAHAVDALWQREVEMMWNHFTLNYAEEVAQIATRALLCEVGATPKPGLVDRNNTGAHRDMDIHTFEGSSLALQPYFMEFVRCGITNCHLTPSEVFPLTRPIGVRAERAMLRATQGINTHKGIIFSLGIVTTALGYLFGNQIPYSQPKLREIIVQMTASLEGEFNRLTAETAVTNGEKLYVNYGIRGVRGEAKEGYPVLFDIAFPTLKQYLLAGYSLNDSGIFTLLHIIANTQDSNIIARSSYETMLEIQQEISDHLTGDRGDDLAYIQRLDADWSTRGISPGGSADLLALAYFLCFYQEEMDSSYGF